MILVALRTGMRQGELLALQWDNVDLVAGRIIVRRNVVWGHEGTPKSGRSREIALGEEVLDALKEHRRDGWRDADQWRDEVAVVARVQEGRLRRIGWHVLRHTFASHLAMRGAPLKAIHELLGHATIMMTMRYAHLAPEIAREAVCLLDGFGDRGKTVAKTASS